MKMCNRCKYCVVILLVTSILSYIKEANSANILGIIPSPFYAHQATFTPLWEKLSSRGHQVTVATTLPINKSSENPKYIDISIAEELYEKYNVRELMCDNETHFYKKGDILMKLLKESIDELYKAPSIQNLIHDESIHFDLVIAEDLFPFCLPLAWHFKCPSIGITSLDPPFHIHYDANNPVHPILFPDHTIPYDDFENLSFKDRLLQTVITSVYTFYIEGGFYSDLQVIFNKYFGPELPPIRDLHKNMSMLFINTNPIITMIRPLSPNTISIGSGIHIKPLKNLSEEVKHFLDEAKNGAIYFSLGSNVKTDFLGSNMTMELLSTLGELPYKVLWRCDILNMSYIPSNVKIMKWFPQQDILRHPNIKLFITQGGLQSLEEAITFGVPVLGIPFFGDQFYNVKRMAKRGFGIELKRENINKETLTKSIQEVINNPKYKETSIKMGKLLHDRPMTGIDEAVWWTEYVIRNEGAKHLKNPSANIPLYQYLLLDVIAFLLLMVILIFSLLYLLVKLLIKLVVYMTRLIGRKTKTKKSKNE